MKKIYALLLFFGLFVINQSKAQYAFEESFTGQSNFGNPTGWSNIDGSTVWNVYPNHGNPSFGLTRSFQPDQSDSVATSSSVLINVALNAELIVDARVMAFSLYPSSSATLPAGAFLAIKGFDGLTTSTILTMTSSNQNQDTGWVTLSGSLNQFAGSQIQLIVVGKNGPNGPADYFIDLDNFRVTDGTVGLNKTSNNKISIFPNPTVGVVNVSGIAENAVITISDILGNIVQREVAVKSDRAVVDIKGLISGIYLVKIESNGSTLTQKVIKN